MKVQELETLKPYRVTKSSGDRTFVSGDIILWRILCRSGNW